MVVNNDLLIEHLTIVETHEHKYHELTPQVHHVQGEAVGGHAWGVLVKHLQQHQTQDLKSKGTAGYKYHIVLSHNEYIKDNEDNQWCKYKVYPSC